jgi:hypothetical protein
LAWLILLAMPFAGAAGLIAVAAGAALIATVFATIYHAEVVANRTGEPFGTLALAVAVTIIEVALIVSDDCSSWRKGRAGARRRFRRRHDRMQRYRWVLSALGQCAPSRTEERAPRWRFWPRSPS